MTTRALVSVSAPGPAVPTLKIQTSLALPRSVIVTPAPIVVPAAEQYTPGASVVVTIGITPVHTGFNVSIAANAASKSFTTLAGTGATIGPVIVHPVLVIPPANVVPTCPKMPIPGPVSVHVTVPIVGMAFLPSTA